VDKRNTFALPLNIDELLTKVIFLHFYSEFKFQFLSRDGKMLGLSPGIKISISSKSGHGTGTFVTSTIDVTK